MSARCRCRCRGRPESARAGVGVAPLVPRVRVAAAGYVGHTWQGGSYSTEYRAVLVRCWRGFRSCKSRDRSSGSQRDHSSARLHHHQRTLRLPRSRWTATMLELKYCNDTPPSNSVRSIACPTCFTSFKRAIVTSCLGVCVPTGTDKKRLNVQCSLCRLIILL